MALKVKVIKRDDTNDRRVTRIKSTRQTLVDRRATLIKEVRQIERQLAEPLIDVNFEQGKRYILERGGYLLMATDKSTMTLGVTTAMFGALRLSKVCSMYGLAVKHEKEFGRVMITLERSKIERELQKQ